MTVNRLNEPNDEPNLDSNEVPAFFELRTLDTSAKSTPINFESLPKALRADIDSLASNIFDPHGGRSLVIGYPMTGKSFLIEQFAANIDRYLARTNIDELVFVCVDNSDLAVMETLEGGFNTWLAEIIAETKLKEEELCFVTESLEVGRLLSTVQTKAKIIFEMSVYLYRQLVTSEMHGQSKTWMSWPSIDLNYTYCNKNELVELLYLSLSEQLSSSFKVNILKKDILLFVNYCIKQIPTIVSSEDKRTVAVPPGLWAFAIRRLAAGMSFDSEFSESDSPKLGARVMNKVFNEVAPHLNEFAELRMDEEDPFAGLPQEMLSQMGITLIPMGNKQEETTEEISPTSEPKVYSDFDTLTERLKAEVIGQDEAVKSVVEGLIVPAAGLNDKDKPVRSIMLLGPTGVGKTKLALTLAQELMDHPLHVVRLDMSEYAQANEAIKLFGAPPGYIGHGQGGTLTNAVEKNPYSLILLDEVEKANPLVWDAFLQVFDAGRMTDGSGKEVDFRNTVIVMTSNLGSRELRHKPSGFTTSMGNNPPAPTHEIAKLAMMKEVRSYFKPELVNRIDEFIVFDTLSQETARKILDKEIGIVYKRAQLAGFEVVEPSTDIIDALLQKSDVTQYGARDIQRTVLKNISSPIARSMLKKARSSKGIALTMNANKEISVVEN